MKTILLATALLALSTSANPFGTVDQPLALNQHAEHEHITRAALVCRTGETAADGNCFEARSLDQIAGHKGTLGGVGAPDSLTPTPEGPEAHCDEADYIDIPGYPNSRANATRTLQECATHLHGRFKQGITFAERLLDPKDQKIRKEMVNLLNNPDGTLNDCQFAGTTPFPGLGRAKCQAIEGLGRALHGVQDFYSHSNWADHSRPGEAISDVNPPGLGLSSLTEFFDFTPSSPRAVAGINVNLTTGCFGGLTSDKTPGVKRCAKRVTHHTMNKDHALIDDNGIAILPTHLTAGPSTPRSEIGDNLQLAVSIAIRETKRQWSIFKENLRTEYGSEDGNTMICAITRDDPLKSCYGRRIALVIDSSGSNTITDPSNFRIAAARQFNDRLVTKAKAGPDELPDEVTVIDFDTSATVIYPMGDPSLATFDGIDSSGGTNIGSGMELGIDELVKTKPDPSTGDPFTPYEENKAGLVILTDGEDFSPANQIAQLNRAADLKIRVAYGFLAPPNNPVPVPKRSIQVQKRAIDTGILEGILKTGGVFATIDSAAAQQNFVQLVYKMGITGINGPAGSAIELLPGLILDRLISSGTGPEIFYYMAVAGEHLRLAVKDLNSRSLEVVIIDVNTNLVVSSGVTDTPNLEFLFEAGPDTIYRIIVTPPAGLTSGLYSIGFASSIPIRNTTTSHSASATPVSSSSTSTSRFSTTTASHSKTFSNSTSHSTFVPSTRSIASSTTSTLRGGYASHLTTISPTYPGTKYTTVITTLYTTLCTLTLTRTNPTSTYLFTTVSTSTITHLLTTTICPTGTQNGDILWPTPYPQPAVPTKTLTAFSGPPICYKCSGDSHTSAYSASPYSTVTYEASSCTTCGFGTYSTSVTKNIIYSSNSPSSSVYGSEAVSTLGVSITPCSTCEPQPTNVATVSQGGTVGNVTTTGAPVQFTGAAVAEMVGVEWLWSLVCGMVLLL